MEIQIKKSFIFIVLAANFLAACGGSGTPAPDNTSITFPNPEEKPVVSADVTTVGECNVLPGEWEFQDAATGKHVTPPTVSTSVFRKKFVKSWGGTTTAHAVWEVEAADEPVWNEGRTVHFGSGGSFTTDGMIHSIHLSGTPANMTALIGTSDGLVIADVVRDTTWALKQQKTVDVMGPVRSVTMTPLILEKNGPSVPMVFMVAGDTVYIAKLADLRAGFGCISVAYQAKDHPVDPNDPANKRTFRPIKVVAKHTYAAFLTASRLPEEFANAAQFKSVLQNEWTTFQSTAYLIDLARQTPVEPIITTMGEFDRFFASDIGIADTAVYLFGSRYKSSKPTAVESGLATYKSLTGTPVVASWTAVPANIGGDFRMGRFDTNIATAYIRGLDKAGRVDNFLSAPTQQKWSVWKEALPFDYVRSVTYRLSPEPSPKDLKVTQLDDVAVETSQFAANGPQSRNWTQALSYGPTYAPITTITNATATDVDYVDDQGRIVHQHTNDNEKAVFPLFESENDLDRFAPRIFHVGNYLFYVRHSKAGPTMHVFQDNITGNIDMTEEGIKLIKKGPALMRFNVANIPKKDCSEGQVICTTTSVAAFENMTPAGGDYSNYRVDDIRMVSNPKLPNLQHFIMLVHKWNGKTNDYRAVALQANLSITDNSNRSMEIQGCSDLKDPGNNYSWNSSYGNPDEQPRFMAPLTGTSTSNDTITYSGYFQHYSTTYNVWSISLKVSTQVMPEKSGCSNAGELTPITDPVAAESLAATLNGDSIVGLHSNSLVRWKIDAKTTQYYDVGNNLLGETVTLQKGHIVSAGTQFITQMDTTDGFHPTAVFTLDGTIGESCPSCQFTDLSAAGAGTVAAHPERGIEFYNFSQ